MKKFLSVILVLSMLLIPSVVFADLHQQKVTFCGESYWFEVILSGGDNGEGCGLQFYEESSPQKDYPENILFPSKSEYEYIPAPYTDVDVRYSSEYQKNIKNIVLENGIQNLSLWFLNKFPKLKQIVIPESVKKISIFGGMESNKNALFYVKQSILTQVNS